MWIRGLGIWLQGHARAQRSDNGIMAPLALAAAVSATLDGSVLTPRFFMAKASHLIKWNDRTGLLYGTFNSGFPKARAYKGVSAHVIFVF